MVRARDRKALSSSQSQADIEMPSSQVASGSQPPFVRVVQEGYGVGVLANILQQRFGIER